MTDGQVRAPAGRLAGFVLAGAILGDEVKRRLFGAVVLEILDLLALC
jgi:hypothetical protein